MYMAIEEVVWVDRIDSELAMLVWESTLDDGDNEDDVEYFNCLFCSCNN